MRSPLARAIGSVAVIGSISACAEPPPPPSAPVVVETVRSFGDSDPELDVKVAVTPASPSPSLSIETKRDPPPPVAGGTISGALLEPTIRADGTKIYTYSRGMTRPVRVSGVDPLFTSEARAHGVEGTALVKCTIEINGSVTGCRLLRGVEFMDDPILAAVSTWKMVPVLVDGRPVALSYTFNVRIQFH